MPRTAITPFTPLGAYPDLPLGDNALTAGATAADVANLNAAAFGDSDMLMVIALNTDTSNVRTVYVTSAEDQYGRSGDIEDYEILAAPGSGESRVAIFGPFKRTGWLQTDKRLYFAGSHATVKFIVVKL